MTDVLITAVPYAETDEPMMAPGLLKSILIEKGFTAKAQDLNIEICNMIKEDPYKKDISDFFYHRIINDNNLHMVDKIIQHCINRIIEQDCKTIAISLLTYGSQSITRWICAGIKQLDPTKKIVIGGPGLKHQISSHDLSFPQELLDLGLIDGFIVGDGEESLVEFLKGNLDYHGINKNEWRPVSSLNDNPIPDFTDYDWSNYAKQHIPINDSRGCVKSCEFCNLIVHWNKYQFRTADKIWEEMLHQHHKYGFQHFHFRNTTTNGNMKEFSKVVKAIADYNGNKPRDQQLSWDGHYIIRSKKTFTPGLWENLEGSNAELTFGVEGMIERVREGMEHKGFTNEDIDIHLDLSRKHKIPIEFIVQTAYPTENLQDYEDTKKWFRDRKEFANNSIWSVQLSLPGVAPNTVLAKKSESMGIKIGKYPGFFFNQNLNITGEVRRNYIKELQKVIIDHWNINCWIDEETFRHTG